MENILIVEDDRFFREMYRDILKDEGYTISLASCGAEAYRMLAANNFGIVITDLVMPDVSGLDILSTVKSTDPSIDVIMVTGNANLESAIFALKHGARDYLIKPVNPEEFKHSVAECVKSRKLLDENEELKNMINLFQASQAIASSLEIEKIYHLVVDAIVRETSSSKGLGIFQTAEGLALKEVKGFPLPLAEKLFEILKPAIDSAIESDKSIIKIPIEELPPEIECRSASLSFIRNERKLHGVVVSFSNFESPAISTKNILFLIEQANQSFANAEQYNRAKDMLFIDDLSGLFNYRYLEVALDRELKRAERYSSHLAVLFLDIDSFKLVNDNYGHLVGSSIIREMGDLLKKSVREVDVVIRYGGDEYTVILVETTCQTADIVAERIRKMVDAHKFLANEGLNIKLTCSIGYACCPEDTMSKIELLKMADEAMYAGKSAGKNCAKRFQRD